MATKPKGSDSRQAEQPGAEAREQDYSRDLVREEKIRRRAYEMYMERGEEPGHDLEDWLQAERELTEDQSRK